MMGLAPIDPQSNVGRSSLTCKTVSWITATANYKLYKSKKQTEKEITEP